MDICALRIGAHGLRALAWGLSCDTIRCAQRPFFGVVCRKRGRACRRPGAWRCFPCGGLQRHLTMPGGPACESNPRTHHVRQSAGTSCNKDTWRLVADAVYSAIRNSTASSSRVVLVAWQHGVRLLVHVCNSVLPLWALNPPRVERNASAPGAAPRPRSLGGSTNATAVATLSARSQDSSD